MTAMTLLRLLLLASPLASVQGQPLLLKWLNFTFNAQHVCNTWTGHCRYLAHAVLVFAPADVNVGQTSPSSYGGVKLQGSWAFDNESAMHNASSAPLAFERHIVSGECTKPAPGTGSQDCSSYGQDAWVFNVNIDEVASPEDPHHSICMAVAAVAQGGDKVLAALPTVCVPMKPETVPQRNTQGGPLLAINNFSTAAWVAGVGDSWQVFAHIVFGLAPAVNALSFPRVTAKWRLDDGAWIAAGPNDVFFESHIDPVNGTYYQGWQFDVDELITHGTQPQVLCWEVTATSAVALKMLSESRSGCLQLCGKAVPFLNPEGYDEPCHATVAEASLGPR